MGVFQQTLISSPYLPPALNFWQVEKDGEYLGRLENSRGSRSSRAARAESFCPSSPHLPALLRTGTSREFFTQPDCPQRTCPQHTLQTPIWPGPGGAALPCLNIQERTQRPVWKQQQIASGLGERPSVNVCVHGFSGEELPYSPWHQPLLCRGKIPAGTLWWCPEFCPRQAYISNITLKYLLGSYCCNFQKRQKQKFL